MLHLYKPFACSKRIWQSSTSGVSPASLPQDLHIQAPVQAEASFGARSACTKLHTKMKSKLYCCLTCAAATNKRSAAACLA